MAIFDIGVIKELKTIPKEDNPEESNYDIGDEDAVAGDASSADEEPPEEDTEDEEGDDYSLEDEEEPTDDTGEEEPTEDDTAIEDEEGDDYSLEDEEPTEDTGEEPVDDETTTEEPEDELKSMEDTLFNFLKPTQVVVRNKELLNNFIDLYKLTVSIPSRLENIPKTHKTISLINFLGDKSEELRDVIFVYLDKSFKERTYTENLNSYYKFISILNQINEGIESMDSLLSKDEKDKK